MQYEVCYFYASRGAVVGGPFLDRISADPCDVVGKFYQRHLGEDVHVAGQPYQVDDEEGEDLGQTGASMSGE